MKVPVIGATGWCGQAAIAALLQRDHSVTAFSRSAVSGTPARELLAAGAARPKGTS